MTLLSAPSKATAKFSRSFKPLPEFWGFEYPAVFFPPIDFQGRVGNSIPFLLGLQTQELTHVSFRTFPKNLVAWSVGDYKEIIFQGVCILD